MNHLLGSAIKTKQNHRPFSSSGNSSSSTNMSSSSPQHPILTSEAVAALPPPGLSGPSSLTFSPRLGDEQSGHYLAFVASASMMTAHKPRRLEVKHANSTMSSSTSTNSNSNNPGGASRSGSSSERQLFVLDIAQILSQQQRQRSSRKLSGPPQPHQRLPILDSVNSAAKYIVHPLLKVPSTSPTTNTNTDSSTKRRSIIDASKNKSQATTGSSVLSSWSSTKPSPQPQQQQQQQQQRQSPKFPNVSASSLVQFSWCQCPDVLSASNEAMTTTNSTQRHLRLLVPVRGSLCVQNGILDDAEPLQVVYDKAQHSPSPQRSNKLNNTTNHNTTDAEDPQLSPDGKMVAFVVAGEIFVAPCNGNNSSFNQLDGDNSVQITFGASNSISHGVADFIAQEEMDRYRGFWWHPDSNGILFIKLDESQVPAFRILHQDVGSGVGPPTTASVASGSNGTGMPSGDSDANSTAAMSSSSNAPPASAATYEDHRYPFAGNANPSVNVGYVKVDYESYFDHANHPESWEERREAVAEEKKGQALAHKEWCNATWYDSPREAPEYLARINWLPDGSACAQWQNRSQNTLVLTRMNVQQSQRARTMLVERSQYWINLHHMMKTLPHPIHPDDCMDTADGIPPLPKPLPEGSFSFFFASERTGYCHLYLYTFVPGYNGDQAVLLKSVSGSGDWMVESIVGLDVRHDLVYVMGTYDSVLERHLYALPIKNNRKYHPGGTDAGDHHPNDDSSSGNHGVRRGLKQVMNALSGKSRSRGNINNSTTNGNDSATNSVHPIRITVESGMHNVVMDDDCRVFVDTNSDLDRPTAVQIFALRHGDEDAAAVPPASESIKPQYLITLYDALHDEKTMTALNLTTSSPSTSTASHLFSSPAASKTHRLISSLPAPELISFPTSDGTETLHAALYRPDPVRHGPGPYPLICAVYGGPHVQRVNRSWSQCADMRAQRLCSLGFCVVKCDNRGSSRRGMAFEAAISRRLGRLEVLDQVATVRQMTLRGIADPTRVGVYGWSYGGYLSAMCLCRAPDVFHVAVAGAPVTSWDGYDTHYTERYMGLPSENSSGYRESAVFDHVPNMRGKLMIVHGLIDENVHFRHTARLINRLIGAGKDYDLLIFPDERHSPRRLRDRIYMEQRISDYFVRHLGSSPGGLGVAMRHSPGHL